VRISSDPLPTQWQVILNDGSVLGVWAGVYGEERDQYVFSVVAEASEAERRDPNVRLTGKLPSKDHRIMFAVARIPIGIVAEIRQTPWDGPPNRNSGFLRS
jgi:hypothetical protein